MTQETRDILYNKQAQELNKNDAKYIDKLISKNVNDCIIKRTIILAPVLFFIVPFIFGVLDLIFINPILLSVYGATGAIVGGLLAGAMNTSNYSLKSLGLTREDWKELKKSGRLKELKQIVKEYNQSKKSSFDNLMELEIDVQTQLDLNEKVRQNLHSELREIKEKEQRLNVKTTHYTQEQVAEMLEIEKSLLLKCLERNKKQQEILDKNADTEILNEVGESAKNSNDYLKQALEACKQFNQEFDGETIDN